MDNETRSQRIDRRVEILLEDGLRCFTAALCQAFPDPQALMSPRPETGLAEQRAVQWGWNPVGFAYIPGLSPPNNLVAQGAVGTVTVVTT